MASTTQPAPAPTRVMSIDALRGFDMFWIIGGNQVFLALVSLFVLPIPQGIKNQMQHVPWEGFTAHDLIMPLFLFIVGAAMPFSFAKRLEQGQSKAAIYRKILIRVAILWVLGMVAQGHLLEYDWTKLHFYSNTLQAIAAGYLIASIVLLHLPLVAQVAATVVLLVGYWACLAYIPVPGHEAGLLEEKLNLALYLDEQILGRFRDGSTYAWILASLAFGATVLLGVHAGQMLRSTWSARKKVLGLVGLGLGCLVAAWVWSYWFPIIKHLFTSSMVLWAAGWSYLLLALFYLVIDVLGYRRWSFVFAVIGANAIAAYMMTHIPGFKEAFYQIANAFIGNLKLYVDKSYMGPLQQVGGFVVLWLVLYYLYRKGTFLRV
ncbi:MAG: DUF5009 domain-containing protein [Thermoguttaceae bacterium]